MKSLEVIDPSMCCSTGVCGIDGDPGLARFAADLRWDDKHGVRVSLQCLGIEPPAVAA